MAPGVPEPISDPSAQLNDWVLGIKRVGGQSQPGKPNTIPWLTFSCHYIERAPLPFNIERASNHPRKTARLNVMTACLRVNPEQEFMLQRRSKQLRTYLARWNVIADCLKVNKVNMTATAAPKSQPNQGATLVMVNNCKMIQRIKRGLN